MAVEDGHDKCILCLGSQQSREAHSVFRLFYMACMEQRSNPDLSLYVPHLESQEGSRDPDDVGALLATFTHLALLMKEQVGVTGSSRAPKLS